MFKPLLIAQGGMRGVAYTDVIQGFILIIGCLCMIIIGFYAYGGLPAVYDLFLDHSPNIVAAPGIQTPEPLCLIS